MENPIIKDIKCSEKYEFNWTVSKEMLMETRKSQFVFVTGLSKVAKAKWEFLLKVHSDQKEERAQITIKLLKIEGTSEALTAHFRFSPKFGVFNSRTNGKIRISETFGVGKLLRCSQFNINPPACAFLTNFVLRTKLEVVLPEYPVVPMDSASAILPPVLRTLRQNISSSMNILLNDANSADVVLMLSGCQSIHAHKIILKAQCPALYDLIQSGKVHLPEISAKTLRLFLDYWYTGNLSKECFEDNTVVEFTNVAGKFKMTPILEMLDSCLGRIEQVITYSHVELLDLIEKLELKTAKANMLNRIIKAVSQVNTANDLFKIFPQDENLVDAHVKNTNILEIWNELVDQKDATHKDVLLLAAVEKQGLKRLEILILEHVVKAANKVQSVDELFGLFGYRKKHTKNQDNDLLVTKSSTPRDELDLLLESLDDSQD